MTINRIGFRRKDKDLVYGKSAAPYFKKIGYEKTVVKYFIQKKHLRWLFFVFVFLLVYLGLILYISSELEDESINVIQNVLMGSVILSAMTAYGSFTFIFRMTRTNDFGFHFAKGCFRILKDDEDFDTIEKSKFIILGLGSYNNFLRRNLKLRINKMEKIYSKLFSNSIKSIDESIHIFHGFLEQEQKLELLMHLSETYENGEDESFLCEDHWIKRFKEEMMPLFFSIIIGITAVVEFLFLFWPSIQLMMKF